MITPPTLEAGQALRVNRLDLRHEPVPEDQTHDGDPSTAVVELGTLGGVELGIWEMSTGSMYDVEAEEVFVVTAGRGVVLIEAFGDTPAHSALLEPGTIMRLGAGMKTVWTVTEPLRKVYFTPAS